MFLFNVHFAFWVSWKVRGGGRGVLGRVWEDGMRDPRVAAVFTRVLRSHFGEQVAAFARPRLCVT